MSESASVAVSSTPVNPYHVMCGVVLGAGVAIIGIQLHNVIQQRRRRTQHNRDRTTSRFKTGALYHSPDPAPLRSSSSVLEDDIDTAEDLPNGTHPLLTHTHSNTETTEAANGSASGVESTKLLNVLYNLSKHQSDQENIFHRGISCNSCSSNPLAGVRYKCVNCVDYDVCLRCEPFCNHDLTHVFVKIEVPIPPMANPRTALLPVFYPGKNCVPATVKWKTVLKLREKTHFDIARINVLYDQYKTLADDERGITRQVFCACLGPLSSKRNLLVEQLFKFYDGDGDGYIDFEEFISGMSVLAKGTKEERLKHIFKGYDVDGDGFISVEDFTQMLKAYHRLSMELVRDVVRSCEEEMMATYDDTGNRPISAVFNAPIPDLGNTNNAAARASSKVTKGRTPSSSTEERTQQHTTPTLIFPGVINSNSKNVVRNNVFAQHPKKNEERLSVIEAMTQDAIHELVEQVMSSADHDGDGKLSEKEFNQYTLSDTSLFAWFEAIDTVF